MQHFEAEFFDDWRDTARRLIGDAVAPQAVRWIDRRGSSAQQQGDLFGDRVEDRDMPAAPRASAPIPVPASFLAVARTVSHHRSPSRWALLYRMLWRITHGEKALLNIASDDDVIEAMQMEKAVRRDAHKMKAFVRFRRIADRQGQHFVAWHRPDHYSLRYTCDFFARRFDVMRWTIMTPDETASWNGQQLCFSAGVPRSEAPKDDELESLWKTYYANIFNPARIKLKAMQAEMPKKHWATLPETELIDQMLRDAPARVERMVRYTDQIATAQQFVPKRVDDLETLRAAAAECRGCQLCEQATQTVFGVGPANASLVFVGEQPGDEEDRVGIPFIGPAGRLLDEVLSEIGLDRGSIYITNAVKHFKFTQSGTGSGKRRLHKKPAAREIAACRPWLESELSLLRPERLVCLGATAGRVVFGPNFRLTEQRGHPRTTDYAPWTLATYHPSALLRASGDAAGRMRDQFTTDLRLCLG